jgi:putative hydrolase of the HAD superfamily
LLVFPSRDIRAVVFDLDNTLLKSKVGARRGLLVAAKLVSNELKRKGYSYGYTRLFRMLQSIDREMLGWKQRYNRDYWWKTLIKQLGLKRLDPSWIRKITLRYWETYAENSPPFKDTQSTLRRLKGLGFKLGMVSDSDGTPGMKMKRIRREPFHNIFEAIIVAGEDTPRVKPGHEAFRLVAQRLGVTPGKCVYVGDNPRTDIKGAKAVGMTTVIVKRRGNHGGNPSYRIGALRDLPRLLHRIQQSR